MAEAVEDMEAVGTDPITLRLHEGVAGISGSPFFIPSWNLDQAQSAFDKMTAGVSYAAI